MNYILIFVFMSTMTGRSTTAQTVEFGTKEACLRAATAVQQQAHASGNNVPVIVCVARS